VHPGRGLIRFCDVFGYFREIRLLILFLESYDEGRKEMQNKIKECRDDKMDPRTYSGSPSNLMVHPHLVKKFTMIESYKQLYPKTP